jgi:methylmalonyl-CoA/ethylmalonyl-CoA epimerase
MDLTKVPGFLFVDHIAMAVKAGELESQVEKYKKLGFKELHREEVLGRHQVREVLLQIGDGPNLIQLLEPLNEDSPVAKQIEKNGGRGGFAHFALRVSDINAAYLYMKENGFNLTQEPGPGSRGTMIFFVHPKDFSALIEVVQETESHA